MFVLHADVDQARYAHLLGLYLGDGHLQHTGRGWQLGFHFDARYRGLIDGAAETIQHVSGREPRRYLRPGWNVVILKLGWQGWPALFPQHGPGRRHTRPIVLAGWQRAIVARHPEALLRGLIESDGCRTINRFTTTLPSGRVAAYAYPRYFFSNESADIRAIFCDACELVGIRWTQSNRRNISVSHRASVAVLDGFVGPKA